MMLSGVDESIFNNVFAVGLREIQELGTLTGTQAASHLFALTAGMDRVSLVDVMRDLRARRAGIVADEGAGAIANLIAQRDKLQAEIKHLAARPPSGSNWSGSFPLPTAGQGYRSQCRAAGTPTARR